MIEVVAAYPDHVSLRSTVRRFGVYLDTWAIIALAKDQTGLRDRFLACLEQGVDILFSATNASEIVGPEQASRQAVRTFFEAIGPSWVAVAMDLMGVIEREAAGMGRESCLDQKLLHRFFAGKNIHQHGEQRLEVVPPEFFNLNFFLDWLVPQRDEIRSTLSRSDGLIGNKLRTLAPLRFRPGFDQLVPQRKYDEAAPATFCFNGLLRVLLFSGKAFGWKAGDSADLCHAVMAASYAQVATLDKHWKARVEALPKPNGLAAVYYLQELDQFVSQIERRLAHAAF